MGEENPDLRTKEQQWRDRRNDAMYVSKRMIESPAFAALKTAAAHKVLMIFMLKRQVRNVRRPMTRDKEFVITNNGEIQFTYNEAREKYGLSDGVFRRAVDELITVGFIDIAHSSVGVRKDCSLYRISERWKAYGTPGFKPVERQKRLERFGFARGNRYGRNARQEDFQHASATVINSYR